MLKPVYTAVPILPWVTAKITVPGLWYLYPAIFSQLRKKLTLGRFNAPLKTFPIVYCQFQFFISHAKKKFYEKNSFWSYHLRLLVILQE
jgi:hypothetical protein